VESITKNRQGVDVLRAMVNRAYGAAQVPAGQEWARELGHGWCNVAYLIRLRDGTPVVLKIAPPAGIEVMTYERDMMRIEVRALAIVREQTAVPVPAVHHVDFSRELCDADYFFMEFVDADNLGIIKDDLPPEQYRAYDEALGAANRAINQIKGDGFGSLLGAQTGATWRQVFTGIFEDVLRDGERRRVDIGWDYDLIREVMAQHADSLDEVAEPAFVEWDLWENNVMVRDGAIVSIIDHERALFGDPIMEAGFVSLELDGMGGDRPGFRRGYGKDSLTPTERVRRRLYNLHLTLIMVIETVYRGHTDPGMYTFGKAKLSEVLDTLGRRR
jgi:aminoglycoside phosphotransferase (APT) family kinase protein